MWIEITVGLVGSVVGAVASSITIWSNLRRPVDTLREKLERLEGERVVKLERKVEAHCEADKSQMILTMLEGLRGSMERVSNKIDHIAEETARQQAKIEAAEVYIKNLDASFERHKAKGGGHGD